jgi:hypothetical protein
MGAERIRCRGVALQLKDAEGEYPAGPPQRHGSARENSKRVLEQRSQLCEERRAHRAVNDTMVA